MRIISGIYKSRRITAPTNLSVRPTTDAGKETLFNILANSFAFPEASFLDLFAGTGNISYEVLSRGCRDVTSVDSNYKCTGFIKSTVAQLDMSGILVVKMDVFNYLQDATRKFDIIFADPPYMSPDTPRIHQLVFERNLLNEHGVLIIEHGNDQNFSNLVHLKDERSIGNVNFTIFKSNVNQI